MFNDKSNIPSIPSRVPDAAAYNASANATNSNPIQTAVAPLAPLLRIPSDREATTEADPNKSSDSGTTVHGSTYMATVFAPTGDLSLKEDKVEYDAEGYLKANKSGFNPAQ